MATTAERYDSLLQWVREGGGKLHPAVEVYHDDVTKGSFRVKSDCSVNSGEAIVALPLSRSLSYLNATSANSGLGSSIPDVFRQPEETEQFPKEFLETVPPHVIGRFFLMQQYILESESFWWPYIRTLPQPEHLGGALPVVWPQADLEFLLGTNAYVAVEEIKSTLKKEYKRAMKLLPQSFASNFTRPLYLWAYSVYTSRSFRPSLVIPDYEKLDLPCAIDDFSVLLPLFDIGNHSPSAKISWSSDEKTQTCSFKVDQPYSAKEQVFNNYGLKTNAELLLGYGFMLPETSTFHNDYVHIRTKATQRQEDMKSTFLVSLRPMKDHSSLVGISRSSTSDDVQVAPQFAYIQDLLIESLFESISGSQSQHDDVQLSLSEILAGRIPDEVMDQLVNALGSKLSYDLETLESIEVPREDLSRNQQLAVTYRDQCRKVLENALDSLGPPG